MTEFVESFATRQLLPPWQAANARTWAFVVALNAQRVEAHLDRFFNAGLTEPAPFHYSPIEGEQYGLLTVSLCPSTTSQPATKAFENWDHLDHKDIFLSFPVMRRAGDAEDAQVVWVQPFMCSNSATVVFSAREIWGCDMTIASIERVDDAATPHHLHLDAAYLGPKTFSPRAVSKKLSFLHIKAERDRQTDVLRLFQDKPGLQAFFGILAQSGLIEPAFIEKFRGAFLGLEAESNTDAMAFELHNLKQVRDVYDMDRALYRAIVATKSHYRQMADFAFLDEAEAQVSFMWSDTMEEFLTTILGAQVRPGVGAPADHADHGGQAGQVARPDGDNGEDHDADWDLAAAPVPVELAFTFTSNIEFAVDGTLYTYAPSYQATR